jgi:hypothetical protein
MHPALYLHPGEVFPQLPRQSLQAVQVVFQVKWAVRHRDSSNYHLASPVSPKFYLSFTWFKCFTSVYPLQSFSTYFVGSL